MPNRAACAAIVLFWIIATFALAKRDILPRWVVGDPPDFAFAASAATDANADAKSQVEVPLPEPSRWLILVPDPRNAEAYREVGKMLTRSDRDDSQPGSAGWILTSEVQLDADRLLPKSLFSAGLKGESSRLNIDSESRIDASGSLSGFQVIVADENRRPMLRMNGKRQGERLEVTADGFNGTVRLKESFPFSRGAAVQNGFSPLERMPNLQVGQVWRAQVVSPLTGAVQTATTEVAARQVVRWRSRLVETFQIVSRMPPIQVRAWVRESDGLLIRQEAPTPLVTVILEREDDPAESPTEKP